MCLDASADAYTLVTYGVQRGPVQTHPGAQYTKTQKLTMFFTRVSVCVRARRLPWPFPFLPSFLLPPPLASRFYPSNSLRSSIQTMENFLFLFIYI